MSLPMDVEIYAVVIEDTQPVEGGRDIQFNFLAVVEHLENFVWATTNKIEFSFVSTIRY